MWLWPGVARGRGRGGLTNVGGQTGRGRRRSTRRHRRSTSPPWRTLSGGAGPPAPPVLRGGVGRRSRPGPHRTPCRAGAASSACARFGEQPGLRSPTNVTRVCGSAKTTPLLEVCPTSTPKDDRLCFFFHYNCLVFPPPGGCQE